MKVWVDTYKCAGHGTCCEIAPSVFAFDDDSGQAIVVLDDVPGDLRPEVDEAVKFCPERAILLASESA